MAKPLPKEIYPTSATDWEKVKKNTPTPAPAVTVDSDTGMVEWVCEMTDKEKFQFKLKFQKKMKIKKIDWDRVSDIYRLIMSGKTISQITVLRRGKEGYSEANIKRISATLSDVYGWKRI